MNLRGLGGGEGNRVEVSAGGSLRLAEMFERAARSVGVKTVRADEGSDIGVIYQEGSTFQEGGQQAPVLSLSWEGWEEHARRPSDTLDNISTENLEKAGRALATALMVLGREIDY